MIRSGQFLQQKQSLSQKLSPQQIQFIKMLQLNTMAMEQRVVEEMEVNPALTDEDNSADDDLEIQEDPFDQPEEKEETEDYDEELQMKELDDLDDTDWEELFNNNDWESTRPQTTREEEEERADLPNKYEPTQMEQLEDQLAELSMSEREKIIAEQILWSIDDDGYFRRDVQSVIDGIAFNYQKIVTEEEVETVLKKIQKMDPPGIAARDLRECLMVQLEVEGLDGNPEKELAFNILKDDWEAFQKKHFSKLKQSYDIDDEMLNEIFDEIKRLNPKPGISEMNIPTEHRHIDPDFIVYEKEENDGMSAGVQEGKMHVLYKGLVIALNRRNSPSLGISRKYKKMFDDLKKQQKTGASKEKIKETTSFLKEKLESAKWFIDSINQRKNTLLSVMETMVMLQEEFFRTGKGIKPMILKDVADRINMDISTVSRVSNGKYVQSHFGIFELKYFFNEGVMTEDGTEVANRVVKNALKKIIDEEDKQKPLSDQALAKELKQEGYPIARRTVSKYREQMNIPVARLRKQII
jgi:RNA polymerase sigma-54 factor